MMCISAVYPLGQHPGQHPGQHSQKHLDALLGAARIEVFLPQVDILAAGEVVNELCVVVGGVVEVVAAQADDADRAEGPGEAGTAESQAPQAPQAARLVQEGELFGEVAFFTETAQARCSFGKMVHRLR